jgi:hypothetical protein
VNGPTLERVKDEYGKFELQGAFPTVEEDDWCGKFEQSKGSIEDPLGALALRVVSLESSLSGMLQELEKVKDRAKKAYDHSFSLRIEVEEELWSAVHSLQEHVQALTENMDHCFERIKRLES